MQIFTKYKQLIIFHCVIKAVLHSIVRRKSNKDFVLRLGNYIQNYFFIHLRKSDIVHTYKRDITLNYLTFKNDEGKRNYQFQDND